MKEGTIPNVSNANRILKELESMKKCLKKINKYTGKGIIGNYFRKKGEKIRLKYDEKINDFVRIFKKLSPSENIAYYHYLDQTEVGKEILNDLTPCIIKYL